MLLTDRSRTIEYQRCPRARLLCYEYMGRGVVPPSLAIELVTGSATHVGVGSLLEGKGVEEAVGLARAEFDHELEGRKLGAQDDESLQYTRLEQLTLVEMLVRLYHARQLPQMLEEFEILGVEREIVMPLTPDLGWMARADAILKRRADGDLYVYSLKTCNEFSERKDEENRLDMQGVSELAAVEWLMGERVAGVKMEFLVKGKRDRYTEWKQDSALVRPWRRVGQFGVEWTVAGRIPCLDPGCKYHKGRLDGWHNLGKEWERMPVWEVMTPKEWFGTLTRGEVLPEGLDALAGLVASPIPYYRNQEDVGRWRRQVTSQETRVAEDTRVCNVALATRDAELTEGRVDARFPQFKRSCIWPTRCPYYEKDSSTCLGTGPTLMDPIGNGMVWRLPHHVPEVEAQSNGNS